MADHEITIDIRPIRPGDKFAGFSIGNDAFLPLKIFLTKKAHKYEEKNLARTYGAFEGDKIIGYVTLVCGEVNVENGDPDFDYRHYPAVKIARLAVHSKKQKSGLGRTFVSLALGIAKDRICPAVGCRFVVVDSKQELGPFYQKCGFTFLDTETVIAHVPGVAVTQGV